MSFHIQDVRNLFSTKTTIVLFILLLTTIPVFSFVAIKVLNLVDFKIKLKVKSA